MIVLPIVDRELRGRARQPTTYWLRCGVAALAALVALQATAMYAYALSPSGVGTATFNVVCWLGFLGACLGSLATADCLSGERREGTLGLLFLTSLKGRDVVLGKLTAAGISAFYALVGFLPSLALALLAGGTSGWTLARTALALLDALFVSLAAGMWISARSRGQLKAMRGTLIFIGALFVWGWVAAHLGPVLTLAGALLTLLNPYSAFYLAPDAAYARGPIMFWLALGLAQLEGWVLLVAATRYLEQSGRMSGAGEQPEASTKQPVPAEERSVAAEAEDRALLEKEPVCWAASRAHGHNLFLWAGALLLLLSGAASSAFTPAVAGMWFAMSLLMSLAAGTLLAWGAGRSLFEARRNGELELLLTTPLGARDIVSGHWWALWRPLRGAWLLVVFLALLQFFFASGLRWEHDRLEMGLDALHRALVPVNKALDGVAVCWVGLWFGLKARKPFLVVAWTVGLVLVLPWVVTSMPLVVLTSSAAILPGRRLGPVVLFWLVIPALLYFVKNLFFIRWAIRGLRRELRATAPLSAGDWPK
ncbi:conserved membrane hypothetical protein [Verrucomicrobia bacterium]|nr:conserved membrane hypothetical protein [Verrucomicrobiota bacterium]